MSTASNTYSSSAIGRMPRWLRILATLCALLVGLRIVLNPVLTWGINYSMRNLPDLTGHVDAVRLSFIPGYLDVDGVAFDLFINDKTHDQRVKRQLLRVKSLRTNWQYWALIRGVVAGELSVEAPQAFLWRVADQQDAAPQAQKAAEQGAEFIMRWRKPLSRLIPVRLDRVDVTDASVKFVDTHTKPRVDLFAPYIDMHLANITNRQNLKDAMYATAKITATLPGKGAFSLDMKMDPIARTPTFSLHTQIKHLNLVELNDLLQAYANFDLKSGGFDVYAELAAHGGEFEGYAKPLLHDLDVRIWQSEGSNNPLKLAWRTTLNAASKLFKNDNADRIGAKVPIEGKFDDPHVELWQAVASLLKNAFTQALLPQLDYTTSMLHLPKKEGK
jgi:hypothetical protein